MTTKHTPGPWVVDQYGDVTANGEDVAHVVGHYEHEQIAANARLIAAAPEMFDVLQRISDEITGRTKDNSLWPDLLAVIRKAEGR